MELSETMMQNTLRKAIDGLIAGVMHENNNDLTEKDLKALSHIFKFDKARLISYLKDKFDIMPIFGRLLVDNYITAVFDNKTISRCMLLTKSGNLNVTYVYKISASLREDKVDIYLRYVASIADKSIQYYKNTEITIDDQVFSMSFADIEKEVLSKLSKINLTKGIKVCTR